MAKPPYRHRHKRWHRREEALQLNENSQLSELAQVLLRRTSPKSSFELAVAECAVCCLTSCEMVHREIAEQPEHDILEGNYFRLNVP